METGSIRLTQSWHYLTWERLLSNKWYKKGSNSHFDKSTSVGGMFIRKLLKLDIKDFGSIKGFTRPLVDAILANQTSTPDVFGTALSLAPQVIETNVNHHPRPEGVSKWTLQKE